MCACLSMMRSALPMSGTITLSATSAPVGALASTSLLFRRTCDHATTTELERTCLLAAAVESPHFRLASGV